jgi:hypothetical protein
MGPIPPPFPNGKGACCVMAVVIVHSKAIFVSGDISFSPLGDIVPEPFDRLRINSASGRRERGFITESAHFPIGATIRPCANRNIRQPTLGAK